MNAAIKIFVLMMAIVANACGSTAVRTEERTIAVATDADLVLPLAAGLTQSFDATQAIVANYEHNSYSFEAHIEARPGHITIVGIGALGGALFSITYDGREMVATGAKEAQVVNAEYVLADVLLTHWDIDWLNQHLRGAVAARSEDGKERLITRGDEPVVRISYETADPWGGAAKLVHLERQYELQIVTAEFATQ